MGMPAVSPCWRHQLRGSLCQFPSATPLEEKIDGIDKPTWPGIARLDQSNQSLGSGDAVGEKKPQQPDGRCGSVDSIIGL
jgi:hypothetical protein